MPNPLTISAIVAMARNRVIGNAGALPWRLSGDLKFFKATTLGKPVVMGRKTYESIGRPLPGRPNIVITRDRGFSAEGITVVHDIDAALAEAERQARAIGAAEIMIIGGAEIYAQALPRTDRLYITEIEADIDGDTVFPALEPRVWQQGDRTKAVVDEASGLSYSFITLDRIGD